MAKRVRYLTDRPLVTSFRLSSAERDAYHLLAVQNGFHSLSEFVRALLQESLAKAKAKRRRRRRTRPTSDHATPAE